MLQVHAQVMDGVTSRGHRSSAKSVRKGGRSDRSRRHTAADQQVVEEQVEEADNLAETSTKRSSNSSSPPAKVSKKSKKNKNHPLTEVQQKAKDASGLKSGK